MEKRFLLWLQHWDGFCKIQWFLYCSSILKLGIRIADWGGSLSRSGLYKIYTVVVSFGSFLRTPFSWWVMLSLVMIPQLLKMSWLHSKMIYYLFFAGTFRKYAFLAYLIISLYWSFSFLSAKKFHLQFCMWDECHVFLIASLVITRLLLEDIFNLGEFNRLMMTMDC